MDIQLIQKDIEFYKNERNKLNDKISRITPENYEGVCERAAEVLMLQDLQIWQKDVAYFNERIFELNKQIYEYEVEEGQK